MKKMITLSVLVLLLSTMAFAQRGRGPGMPGPRGGPEAALKEALNLTEGQVSAVAALNETRMSRAQAIRTEIETLSEAFEALVNAQPPNVNQVGTAALALRAAQNKLGAERDWYIAELKKLLTTDQATTLDTLLANQKRPLLPGFGPGGRGGPPR